MQTRLVVERGKYILNKAQYEKFKKATEESIILKRKSDSINALKNGTSSTFINDATLYPPKFQSLEVNFNTFVLKDLKISENIQKGKNTFCIVLDETGKITKVKTEKTADRKLARQVRKKLRSYQHLIWTPSYFHSFHSGFHFRFSVIADTSFEDYNLKNQWARYEDSNISDFQ